MKEPARFCITCILCDVFDTVMTTHLFSSILDNGLISSCSCQVSKLLVCDTGEELAATDEDDKN